MRRRCRTRGVYGLRAISEGTLSARGLSRNKGGRWVPVCEGSEVAVHQTESPRVAKRVEPPASGSCNRQRVEEDAVVLPGRCYVLMRLERAQPEFVRALRPAVVSGICGRSATGLVPTDARAEAPGLQPQLLCGLRVSRR
jgi:hypothetical protein